MTRMLIAAAIPLNRPSQKAEMIRPEPTMAETVRLPARFRSERTKWMMGKEQVLLLALLPSLAASSSSLVVRRRPSDDNEQTGSRRIGWWTQWWRSIREGLGTALQGALPSL